MKTFFNLSKERTIHWVTISLSFSLLWYLAGSSSSVSALFIVCSAILMIVAFFGLFKFIDKEEKQAQYEKRGFTYLATTVEKETILTYSVPPSKLDSETYLLIAIFNEDGYLVRQSKLSTKDIDIVQLLLREKMKTNILEERS